jgi:large subunit ribosomal protein L3
VTRVQEFDMSLSPDSFKGILGRKLGMTQLWEGDRVVPVTVIEAGPCHVLHTRSKDTHGYSAVALAFGDKKERRVNKPEMGQFKKAGLTPTRWVREFRLDGDPGDALPVGSELKADVFEVGEIVDATGTSKGKGFQGVVKRHGFSGVQTVSHGTHESFRHGGAVGCRLTPGRIFKGKRMGGHMGDRRVTIQNLQVVRVDAEKHQILVRGNVPGATGCLVKLQAAIKKKNPRKSRAT